MQTLLLNLPSLSIEELHYQRAALRECIAYGEHGEYIETATDGRELCFNCGGSL